MRKGIVLIIALIIFSACDDIIEVDDISEAIVTVLAPKNDASIEAGNITFTWDAVEEATAYKIQIATPSFEDASQILTDSLATNTVFNKTLSSGSFEWRVRAENSGYVTAYSTQKITVTPLEPVDISANEIVLLSPADNTSFLTTDAISFSWESINGAEEYSIQIATPNFENTIEIIKDEMIKNTSYSVSDLSKNSYEWRVKAVNPYFETGYTSLGFVVGE